MPAKSDRAASGLSSSWDWLWLSGASSRCPATALGPFGVGEGVRGAVGAFEPLLPAAPAADSILPGRLCSARRTVANSPFGRTPALGPARP
eukprot:13325912-Alexandrium_andersonii.AAC.1